MRWFLQQLFGLPAVMDRKGFVLLSRNPDTTEPEKSEYNDCHVPKPSREGLPSEGCNSRDNRCPYPQCHLPFVLAAPVVTSGTELREFHAGFEPLMRGQVHVRVPPNGSPLSCGALQKDSFLNLRAPSASSAC